MQVRLHSAAPLYRSMRLVLWLAAALFVFQVPLHASTPAHATMAEWMNRLVTADASTHGMDMPGMTVGGNTHAPETPVPGDSGHGHHAEGLCCMPPVALLPTFWTPPPLPLRRQALTPPKAVRESLLILRATARGPPSVQLFALQAA